MNRKVSLLIVSIALTIIVFGISTYMQKKLINYTPTIKCIIANQDIEAYTQISEENISYIEMPISILAHARVIENISEIKDLYLKDKIYKGQVLVLNQFDTKKNLMIYQGETGKEKIAIKIKSAENGSSYTIRENSLVNVYATLREEYANGILENMEKHSIGKEEDGYFIVKILDSVKILGTFNSEGESLEETNEKIIDTILISVTPDEAKKINLIRDIGVFNITEISNINLEEQSKDNISIVAEISGDGA